MPDVERTAQDAQSDEMRRLKAEIKRPHPRGSILAGRKASVTSSTDRQSDGIALDTWERPCSPVP